MIHFENMMSNMPSIPQEQERWRDRIDRNDVFNRRDLATPGAKHGTALYLPQSIRDMQRNFSPEEDNRYPDPEENNRYPDPEENNRYPDPVMRPIKIDPLPYIKF